jgi:hypothetical protein
MKKKKLTTKDLVNEIKGAGKIAAKGLQGRQKEFLEKIQKRSDGKFGLADDLPGSY